MTKPVSEYFILSVGHYWIIASFGSFIILHNILLFHISVLD